MSRRRIAAAGAVVATWVGVCSADAAVFMSPQDLPAGVVAVVREAPPGVNTISLHAFHHGMAQWAGLRGLRSAPKSSDRRYERAKKSVLTDRLERIDFQGQAQEMGITAPAWEVARAVASIKQKNFKNHADYVEFLKKSHYTRGDVFESVRIQILAELVEAEVFSGIEGKKARHAAVLRFRSAFVKRWRPRNVCAPRFVVALCSNGPSQAASS